MIYKILYDLLDGDSEIFLIQRTLIITKIKWVETRQYEMK